MESEAIKRQVKKITDAMTFVWEKAEKSKGRNLEMYFLTYQLLGYAWEFIGQQCKRHKFRFKKRDKRWVCEWCGKVKQ